MNRLVLFALCFWLSGVAAAEKARADDNLNVLPNRVDSVAPQEMLHTYLMKTVYESVERRDAEYEKIKTPEQAAAYQARLRDFFVTQLGGLPDRTPLNARVVGSQQRDGYRIEKVIFESQPHHYVTAILYLPSAAPPYPGVLVPCGHSANGKARDLYQRAPILLAKCGMAALCYDPLDQGERHQLLDATGKPLVTQSTMGHNLAGVGAILLGRNTATYRVWDGMRAIDYLASRPEVDATRIGCTGISGGGTMTSYLMALDDRISAAAPGCYLTSFRRLLETIGPQDAEQNIYAQIAYGMDHADYILMRAPVPTLIMTATEDFFDIDGAWRTFRQAKRWYARTGFSERIDLLEVDGKHGFPQPMRVAAARWMRRWLLQTDDAITESPFPVAPDKELWCTPRGEVMLLDDARSVYDLNADCESKLATQRKQFWQSTPRDAAIAAVRRIAGIRPRGDLPTVRCEQMGEIRRTGYSLRKLVLHFEPGIYLPALAFVPDKASGNPYLYLHADGKQVDAAPGGAIEKLVLKGHLVLAPDLRGIGETKPDGKHSYGSYLPPEWLECNIAYLLGRSLLGMRAEDILACMQFVASYETDGKPNSDEFRPGGKLRPVHLVSVGNVGPATLHAAALEPELLATLTLRRSLGSWSNVVHTPLSKNQFVNLVHGALRDYDLPDLVALLPQDKVNIIEPLDAAEQPLP